MALLPIERLHGGMRADPTIYPQNLNLAREAFLFTLFERSDFLAASFLDDRVITPKSLGRWASFHDLAPLMDSSTPSRPLHFIFHAGHVGSTLVSRLLDDAGRVHGLREPLPLRVLAELFDEAGQPHALADVAQGERLLYWLIALWSRGFADTEAVVLKATSSAARLGPALMAAAPQSRAICLNLGAEPYLATLLAGENSHIDLRGHGPERHRRLALLAKHMPTPLAKMSLGEIAALTWLTEALTHQSLRFAHGDAVLQIDFDEFLTAPDREMRAICTHLGLERDDAFFASIPQSPTLRRYSKAPEHAYTIELRQQILAQSRTRHAVEIRKGLGWLQHFAREAPLAASILNETIFS